MNVSVMENLVFMNGPQVAVVLANSGGEGLLGSCNTVQFPPPLQNCLIVGGMYVLGAR